MIQTAPKPDKYDRAIAHLRKHPDQIYDAWVETDTHKAGCLFRYVTNNGHMREDDKHIGCLTMIRNVGQSSRVALLPSLTMPIRRDTRIPRTIEKTTTVHLPVFAEWQRRIDHELCRP